jgi:hypothetical protein
MAQTSQADDGRPSPPVPTVIIRTMSRGRIAAHTESHAQLDIYARDAEGEKAS